jgi:hypothetical protein
MEPVRNVAAGGRNSGGAFKRRQAAPRFLGFILRQARLQGGDNVDDIAAGGRFL